MEKRLDFVAVDFEWKSSDKDVCALGMVKVMNSVVVGKYYSLVKPKTDEWDEHCCHPHGITPEMVQHAPTFAQLEPLMETFVGDLPLVGHNYEQAEKHVFANHARPDSPLRYRSFFDTMKDDKRKLIERCAEFGIPLEEHHDALEDAMATALLFMKLQDAEIIKPTPSEKPKAKMQGSKRDSSLNYKVEADKVPHPDTPFMDAKFVVSGFPDAVRDKIIAFLRDNFGGHSTNNLSGKTKILVGHSTKCGPSKLEKAKGFGCIIYNETTLFEEVIAKCGLMEEWKKTIG